MDTLMIPCCFDYKEVLVFFNLSGSGTQCMHGNAAIEFEQLRLSNVAPAEILRHASPRQKLGQQSRHRVLRNFGIDAMGSLNQGRRWLNQRKIIIEGC